MKYKVQVSSGHAGYFNTQEEANTWIEKVKPWGNNPDRWLKETDGSHLDRRTLFNESTGEVLGEEYFFLKDYSYAIIDLSVDPAYIAQKRLEDRKNAYNKDGVTQEALLEALIEHIIEGRSEKLNALQIKREKVKAEIP